MLSRHARNVARRRKLLKTNGDQTLLKILVHDFAGHPFQMQLSKTLGERGNNVCHLYFAGDKGPKGTLQDMSFTNGGSVKLVALGSEEGYEKGAFIKRVVKDLQYRSIVSKFVRAGDFDVVISGNTPLWVQGGILRAAQSSGARFIFWCQDFYSIAVAELLKTKVGVLAKPVGKILEIWDKLQFARSDHIVHITDRFSEQTQAWGLSLDKTSVISNWGAIDELPLVEKQNNWRCEQGFDERPVVLYSGTLGLKHNPELICAAAKSSNAHFVVVGFGLGYEELKKQRLSNLTLLPLQRFEVFPEVLGSAELLVAVIEREAGTFSVPSKLLSYLCSGRPIVLAAPADNLASTILLESGAGIVVEPEDVAGFEAAVSELLADDGRREQMGLAARRYAEKNFDIEAVATNFEQVFYKALGRVK